MKTFVLIASLLTLSQARAQTEVVTYDYKTLDLLNAIVENCSAEITQAVKSYHRPGAAKYSYDSKSGRRLYTIEFVTGGFAPSFQTYNGGKLTLKMTPKPMDPLIADAPTEYRVECKLALKN